MTNPRAAVVWFDIVSDGAKNQTKDKALTGDVPSADLLHGLDSEHFDVIKALSRYNARRVKQMIVAINVLIVCSIINNVVFDRGLWLTFAASAVFLMLLGARRLYDNNKPDAAQNIVIWTIVVSVSYITWQGNGLRDQIVIGNAVMLCSVTAVTVFILANDMRHLLSRYNTEYRKARASEDEIIRLANHDTLTGLPNLFTIERRYQDKFFGPGKADVSLLMFGLDNFKSVNDSLGHVVGDMVLKTIADRLTGMASPQCTVFRVAGDVFGMLTPSAITPEDVEYAAERIAAKISEPLGSGHQFILLTC